MDHHADIAHKTPNIPHNVHIIDLNFQNSPRSIAAYAIEHSKGLVLVECGPVSTLPNLIHGIEEIGFSIEDITDVLLTHIHLDHAGAAGTLSKGGVNIHVHPKGAAHLLDPQKLIASASRIYGELMPVLWGNIQPVSPDKLHILAQGEIFYDYGIKIQTVETPGHAEHHNVYIYNNLCFTGDIGGIRLSNAEDIILPTPPPEFHIEKWINSLENLLKTDVDFIAPTHFGIFGDAKTHFKKVAKYLFDLNAWLEELLTTPFTYETFSFMYKQWIKSRLNSSVIMDQFERINPSSISAAGVYRYLQKNRC